jgi:hypothetical protein|tara:strand:- start:83 stop:211 length:129 start_codon:yes stop_codon:yes gene_type:complete
MALAMRQAKYVTKKMGKGRILSADKKSSKSKSASNPRGALFL